MFITDVNIINKNPHTPFDVWGFNKRFMASPMERVAIDI